MSDVMALDHNGDPLAVGDVCTVKVSIIGDAGGTGQVKLKILQPDLTSRTGGGQEQLDIIPVFDAYLLDKD